MINFTGIEQLSLRVHVTSDTATLAAEMGESARVVEKPDYSVGVGVDRLEWTCQVNKPGHGGPHAALQLVQAANVLKRNSTHWLAVYLSVVYRGYFHTGMFHWAQTPTETLTSTFEVDHDALQWLADFESMNHEMWASGKHIWIGMLLTSLQQAEYLRTQSARLERITKTRNRTIRKVRREAKRAAR